MVLLLKSYISVLLLLQFRQQLLAQNSEPKGEKGDRGLQGPPGNAGPPGPRGFKGDRGDPGSLGLKGEQGPHGPPGFTGSPGLKGEQGPHGPPGFTGSPGLKGEQGPHGLPGFTGSPGLKGEQGPRGLPGFTGSPGLKGEQGPHGLPGFPGSAGLKGMPGSNGFPGQRGEQGSRGLTGSPGLTGMPGRDGLPGLKGERGPPGPPWKQGRLGDDITSLKSEIQHLNAKIAIMEKLTSFDAFRKVGQKYFVYDGLLESFDNGIKWCKEIGGTIALPRNADENRALLRLSVASGLSGHRPYVGVTDRVKEGQFVDIDGKPLTFTKWGSGQPDDYKRAQDCGGVIVDSGFWDDVGCDDPHYIICEIEIK